jgi:hypothetical protein
MIGVIETFCLKLFLVMNKDVVNKTTINQKRDKANGKQ